MAPSLAPNAHSASIQGPDGDIRIYTQIRNGAIVEWSGTGPLAFGTTHTSRVIVPPGVARIGTPLAATYWGGTKNGNFCEMRFFFVSKNNLLRELISNDFSNS